MSDAVAPAVRWAKVIDHTRCIGCHACSTACKSENEVPLSVHRTYVKYVDVGTFPEVRRAFQVTRCNQCASPPCVSICPTTAMFQRHDGIVDFDKDICIGCKACIAACPYDAIFINPEDNAAEKCNFCAHRIDMGLEPACVVVCPTEAILVGDMLDTTTKVASYVNRDSVQVRRPEKEAKPKLFYKGAHSATLDPLAAERPDGGIFMWSEQQRGGVQSGHPRTSNSAAGAMLSYDIAHDRPWGWKVSLYTWTKGIAAGAYFMAAFFVLFGWMQPDHTVFRWVAPIVSGTFLGITGGLLIWDLKRPERFLLIFRRPQWKSWLVRGSFIILGYSIVLGLHFLASIFGGGAFARWLAGIGVVLAGLTAIYTAFLFAQAKARDLWQSPLLPPHLLLQSAILGTACVMPFLVGGPLEDLVLPFFPLACALHLMFVFGEIMLTHPTAHAELAVFEMTRGRYAMWFWASVAFVVLAIVAPLGWVWALVGLLLYEHAHVRSAQEPPIA
ncbi:MAG: ferredoxin [Planctomycetes bacterium]|nr:ferredoxin [Planctomycetota bacterium]